MGEATQAKYVKVDGINELRAALKKLADKSENKRLGMELKSEFRTAAAVVVADAKSEVERGRTAMSKHGRARTPTGRLASTIRPKSALRGATIMAGGVNKVRYAGPIHYGWPRRNIQRNAFLTRAMWRNRDMVRDIMSRGVERITAEAMTLAKKA